MNLAFTAKEPVETLDSYMRMKKLLGISANDLLNKADKGMNHFY